MELLRSDFAPDGSASVPHGSRTTFTAQFLQDSQENVPTPWGTAAPILRSEQYPLHACDDADSQVQSTGRTQPHPIVDSGKNKRPRRKTSMFIMSGPRPNEPVIVKPTQRVVDNKGGEDKVASRQLRLRVGKTVSRAGTVPYDGTTKGRGAEKRKPPIRCDTDVTAVTKALFAMFNQDEDTSIAVRESLAQKTKQRTRGVQDSSSSMWGGNKCKGTCVAPAEWVDAGIMRQTGRNAKDKNRKSMCTTTQSKPIHGSVLEVRARFSKVVVVGAKHASPAEYYMDFDLLWAIGASRGPRYYKFSFTDVPSMAFTLATKVFKEHPLPGMLTQPDVALAMWRENTKKRVFRYRVGTGLPSCRNGTYDLVGVGDNEKITVRRTPRSKSDEGGSAKKGRGAGAAQNQDAYLTRIRAHPA